MGNEVNKNHKAHPNLSHPMTRVVVPLKFDYVRRYLIDKLGQVYNGTGLDCLIYYFKIISQKIYQKLKNVRLIQRPQSF